MWAPTCQKVVLVATDEGMVDSPLTQLNNQVELWRTQWKANDQACDDEQVAGGDLIYEVPDEYDTERVVEASKRFKAVTAQVDGFHPRNFMVAEGVPGSLGEALAPGHAGR